MRKAQNNVISKFTVETSICEIIAQTLAEEIQSQINYDKILNSLFEETTTEEGNSNA